MASGRPVIAYRKGGALETVEENVTGIFFDEQSIKSLNEAVNKFEVNMKSFSPVKIREHAEKFNKNVFKSKMKDLINKII